MVLVLVLALSVTMLPFSGSVKGDDEHETGLIDPIDYHQAVIDEAEELGVPNAFIRHNFSDDYRNGKIEEPVIDLQDGEAVSVTLNPFVSSADERGLEIKKVDTGVLARTTFDLGEYDFGDGSLKLGYLIYNMVAYKTLKGTGYLYMDDETDAFATISIDRCAEEDYAATKNKVVDMRNKDITGTHRIHFKFIAESAKDDQGNLKPVSKVKGNLFISSLFFTEGSTPVLDFDLDKEINTIEQINGSPKHTIMGYGNMNIKIPDGYECEYTDAPLSDTTLELDYIRGRGNSTWLAPKKPYKVKLEKSTDLFGMGKSKHWVMLANYYDYSLLRNKMTYTMADRIGLEYSPKSVFVDVVISGEYCGSYQLSQQVRIGKGNVNIDDLEDKPATEEPEITGGYLLAMGTSWLQDDEEFYDYSEDNPYDGSLKYGFVIDRPEYEDDYPEDAKIAQIDYMNSYLDKIQNAVELLNDENSDGTDEDGKTWRDYMDEQSFIDYFLIQEMSKNGDAYGGSTYAYKKRSDKLFWGPVWDFDFVAWGANSTSCIGEGWFEEFSMVDSCPWFATLIAKDPEFKQHVIERWNVISQTAKEMAADGGFLDQYRDKLYYSALANYQVRGSYLMDGVDYWGDDSIINYDDDGELYILNYGNEIDRLKRTVNATTEWMDDNIDSIDSSSSRENALIPFMVDGEVVAYVRYDGYNERVVMEDIPADPVKEGKRFVGWFYVDEDGEEVRLREDSYPFIYEEIGEDDYEEKVCDVYAKFIDNDKDYAITAINFPTDTIYVPLEEYEEDEYGYGEINSGYYNEYIDLSELVSVIPFEADAGKIKYSSDATSLEEDGFEVSEDGMAYINQLGTFKVHAQADGVDKVIRVVGVDTTDIYFENKFFVEDNLELNVGDYGDLKFMFEENTPISAYSYVKFKSTDDSIVSVDSNGYLHANKPGTAFVLTVSDYESMEMKFTKVEVKDNSKPDPTVVPTTVAPQTDVKVNAPKKSVVKKAVKKTKAKKLNLTLKKIKGAKGYQVAVYKTKKAAKSNKKALVKKYVKKLKVAIKSKKLKNKKKLYVRARAYVMDGKAKKYGAWSKAKKVKNK